MIITTTLQNLFGRDVWLTSKEITSTMINADIYTDFMINGDKNADSIFNTKNF